MTARTLLSDVALAVSHFTTRRDQASRRGDFDGLHEASSVLREIEDSVVITERRTGWRQTISAIVDRDAKKGGHR